MDRFRTSSPVLGCSSLRSDARVVLQPHLLLLLQEPGCPCVCVCPCVSVRGGGNLSARPGRSCCPLSLQHPLPARPAHDSRPAAGAARHPEGRGDKRGCFRVFNCSGTHVEFLSVNADMSWDKSGSEGNCDFLRCLPWYLQHICLPLVALTLNPSPGFCWSW